MRRLSQRGDEHGAVIVLLAGFSVAMVAMAALVVDVGAILDEKRQLQNGADSGALAVAYSCAVGPTCDQTSAAKLANDNSRDKNSFAAVTPDILKREVLVQTETRVGASTILPYSFGRLLTNVPKTVHAKATGKWDFAGTALALPIAISPCDKAQLKIGVAAVIDLGGSFGPCPGHPVAGGFGYLTLGCQTTMNAGTTIAGDTGANAYPKNCMAALKDTIIVLPIFDIINGSGGNATFHISGFAALRLTGWKFSPNEASTPAPSCGSNLCIAGTFVNYVTTATTGGGADFGIFRVFLGS